MKIRSLLPPLNYVLTCAAAVILICELLVPPVVGYADNGDFAKILGRYRLSSGQDFQYADTHYFFKEEYRYGSGFNSSERLVIAPALKLYKLTSHSGAFDIRFLGAVYGVLFLLAVFLLAPAWSSVVPAALAVIMFCDFMYVGYFHSFYMDAAAVVFLLLTVVFFLRAIRWHRTFDSVALFVSMVLVVTSKTQYAMLGVWFALIFWFCRRPLCRGRKGLAAGAVVALLLTSWISFRFFSPESYSAKGPFTVIFSRILPNAANPGEALTALGLDDSWRKWIGQNAYSEGTRLDEPEYFRPFLRLTSNRKIGAYYLRHPAETWKQLVKYLGETGRFKSSAGNFDSHSGQAPGTAYEGFQWTSRLKRSIFLYHGEALFAYFLGLSLSVPLLLLWIRDRVPEGAVAGGVVLGAMAMTTLLVSALADVYEEVRHQLLALAMFDILLVALVWLLLARITARRY